MGETKFNAEQMNRPAPLWYRRFMNAMVVAIIPAASGLIQGWGLSEVDTNRVLQSLIFLAAVIKGVGIFLGNGQNYADKALVIALGGILLLSCGTVKNAGDKEQAYIDQLQDKYENDTAAPVILTVPGGMIHLTDTTPCPDFVNTEVTSKGGLLTLIKPCPPLNINVDSVVRNSDLYKAAILARRDAEISADQERERRLKTDGANEQLQKSGRVGWALFIGLAIAVAVFVFIRIKSALA